MDCKITSEGPEQKVRSLKNSKDGFTDDMLNISERRYRYLYELAPDMYHTLNMDGVIVDCNRAWTKKTGYLKEEIIGKSVSLFFTGNSRDAFFREFSEIAKEEEVSGVERDLVAKDGTIINVDVEATRIFDEDDNTTKFLVIMRDITKRKKVERALKRLARYLEQKNKETRRLSRRLISLLERDRHKLAMELHDQIGQSLTSVKMDVEMLAKRIQGADRESLEQISGIEKRIAASIREVKNICHGLRPSTLDTIGLIPSIQMLVDDIGKHKGVKAETYIKNLPSRLEPEKEITIYRVVQEALNNIAKHANAGNIFINLIVRNNVVSLSIEDDGVGFDPEGVLQKNKEEEKGALGILIMKERVAQHKGEFYIESQVDKGTILLVEVPI